jgi:hypothetical protein
VLLNNDEVQETIERDTNNALRLATVAKTLKDAGMMMDVGYFVEETGIPVSLID